MSSLALIRSRERPMGTTAPRLLLIVVALAFLSLVVIAPVAAVFVEAFRHGSSAYVAAISEPDALSAIRLTLLTAAIVVPLNTLFGIAAAWALTRARFRGKSVLITLIDLPFAISPVIAGLLFVQLFGPGAPGSWLSAQGVDILFATPGVILATLFVTSPFVARELIAFLETQGREQEEAAAILGASHWQTFLRVTLPGMKWALLYGVALCAGRTMGEFGAVSVVSGHIRGETNTLPLHVEILYSEFQFSAAFAVASLLILPAVLTLITRNVVERRKRRTAGGNP